MGLFSDRRLLAAILFLGSFALDTRENGFPYIYHPDESGKVEQVLHHEWNFHHPLLLLLASAGVREVSHSPADPQAIVEVGRGVSAFFASVAVAALGLIAVNYRGPAAGWIAGLFALLHHQLFELAHYMKEDTALLMGIALVFLALAAFQRQPGAVRAALCGLATALAISGKYLGVVMIAAAVPVLLSAPAAGFRQRGLLLYFVALAAGLAALNFPLFAHIGIFEGGLSREVAGAVRGHHGLTRRIPNFVYTKVFLDNSNPGLWILAGWQLIHFFRTRKGRGMNEWMLHLFPVAFTILLSFSPKTNDRYFLPVTGVICALAGMGAVSLAEAIGGPRRWLWPAAASCVAAGFELWSLGVYYRAFGSDDRTEMIAYIRAHLPAQAVLLEDKRVHLRDVPQRVIEKSYAADYGTLAEAEAGGLTHVAVCDGDYGRFFLASLAPQDEAEEKYDRRKKFYEELFTQGKRVWAKDSGTVLYLHPGLELYELPAALPPAR